MKEQGKIQSIVQSDKKHTFNRLYLIDYQTVRLWDMIQFLSTSGTQTMSSGSYCLVNNNNNNNDISIHLTTIVLKVLYERIMDLSSCYGSPALPSTSAPFPSRYTPCGQTTVQFPGVPPGHQSIPFSTSRRPCPLGDAAGSATPRTCSGSTISGHPTKAWPALDSAPGLPMRYWW